MIPWDLWPSDLLDHVRDGQAPNHGRTALGQAVATALHAEN
jgi:hypothetical protein